MKLKHAFCLFSFDGISDFKVLFDLFQLFRVKIEKEKKKVAQEAGFLRTEVTGGEVSVLYLTAQLYGRRDGLHVVVNERHLGSF